MLRRLLFANFRLAYRLSRYARDRFTPGGQLILGTLIFSGIFGFDTRQTLAFQIFSLCVTLLLIAFFTSLMFRGNLRVQRLLPEFGTVDHPLKYKVLVDNPGKHPQRDLVLLDELQEDLPDPMDFFAARDPEDTGRNWFDRVVGYPRLIRMIEQRRGASIAPTPIMDLAPGDHAEILVELQPVRRGYLRFCAAKIARPDPLGLMQAVRKNVLPGTLLILPLLYRVPMLKLPGGRKYQQGGLTSVNSLGDSQEFISLRDYRPGDPLRSIHWRSYAKLRRPVVKEYQNEFIVRQGLVLDTFLANGSAQIFEDAVSLAASFAHTLTRGSFDSLLDLMFVGARAYRFTTGRGVAQPETMLEVLACVEPCRDKSFQILRDLVQRHAGETSGLICIFVKWDDQRRALLEHLLAAALPVYVFMVQQGSEAVDPGAAISASCRFVNLNCGSIQEQLDQLGG